MSMLFSFNFDVYWYFNTETLNMSHLLDFNIETLILSLWFIQALLMLLFNFNILNDVILMHGINLIMFPKKN